MYHNTLAISLPGGFHTVEDNSIIKILKNLILDFVLIAKIRVIKVKLGWVFFGSYTSSRAAVLPTGVVYCLSYHTLMQVLFFKFIQ